MPDILGIYICNLRILSGSAGQAEKYFCHHAGEQFPELPFPAWTFVLHLSRFEKMNLQMSINYLLAKGSVCCGERRGTHFALLLSSVDRG